MISEYPPNLQDVVRRYYLINWPIQPCNHKFPHSLIRGRLHRCNPSWYEKYGIWMEYSIKKDVVFCLCCYLFDNARQNHPSGDFVREGYSTWNKAIERFNRHVGDHNSAHNKALRDYKTLRKLRQSIKLLLISTQMKQEGNTDFVWTLLFLVQDICCVRDCLFVAMMNLKVRKVGEIFLNL